MSYDIKNLGYSIFELSFSKPISDDECDKLNYFFDNLPYHLMFPSFATKANKSKSITYYDFDVYSKSDNLLIDDYYEILKNNQSFTGYTESDKFNNSSILKIYPEFNLAQKFIYSFIYNNISSFNINFNNNSVIIHFDKSFEYAQSPMKLISLINDFINPSPLNIFLNINPNASKNDLSGNIDVSMKAGSLLVAYSLSVDNSIIKFSNNINQTTENVIPKVLENLISYEIINKNSSINILTSNKKHKI